MHPITHAAQKPNHPAIVMAGSGETVSYGELDRTANRFARLLRAHGLVGGDHFAMLMENNALYLQLVWGSQRAGTMMVPVSTRLTAPEIAYILRDAGVRLLITSVKYADVAAALQMACPDCEALLLGSGGPDDLEAALAEHGDAPLADPIPGQYMLYSSGTTGSPKGVKPRPPETDDILAVNPLVGLAVMGAGMPADGSMVYLSPAPLYHAAPLGWCTTAHRLGATIVIMEKFEPEHALQTIEKYGVTDSQWVPTHFVRMLKLPEEVCSRYDLTSHRRAIHAAAPCPVPVKRAMIEWWGPIIIEYYAGSEGIGMTLIKSEDWLAHPGSVGRAIHGKLHICDGEGGEVPPDIDGLIYFEIDTVPTYHNDPVKTAEAMHPSGWMTLGDIGHVDPEGYLYLTDRKSHMIISGGVNIYPQEIENLLVTHPKVMDAAVIGAPEPDLGEQVVAVVQPMDVAGGGDGREGAWGDCLGPRVLGGKTPRRFACGTVRPREANGKLYKRELRDEFKLRAEQGEAA